MTVSTPDYFGTEFEPMPLPEGWVDEREPDRDWPTGEIAADGSIVTEAGKAVLWGIAWIPVGEVPEAQGHGWKAFGFSRDGVIKVVRKP
jgi:hypothetical protein